MSPGVVNDDFGMRRRESLIVRAELEFESGINLEDWRLVHVLEKDRGAGGRGRGE